ncbi:MAG: hypothetical protein JW863_20940 [Chitinispirillaceae bacterium]|nr:hypothetical protein [Chitinispirillaceae bacterium]
MRQFKRFLVYTVSAIFPLLVQTGCGNESGPVAFEELPGTIVGKINLKNGEPARNVTVRLTPVDYDPYIDGAAASIESTTTDGTGRYAFSVRTSGFFNVTSRKDNLFSYRDSVYGANNIRFEASTDTLKESGSITGSVRLRPEDDNRSVIILVPGTSMYTQPEDTSGTFVINDLAEGEYRLVILTTDKGYGVLEIRQVVTAGETTHIEVPVELPWTRIPEIGTVRVDMNSAMQLATLSWPPVDTTNVQCLWVFRNTPVAGEPYAVLAKTATEFIDDGFDSIKEVDTLRYSIAACGLENRLGPAAMAPDVPFESMLHLERTIPLYYSSNTKPCHACYADTLMNIYVCGTGWISRIDSAGNVIAEYCDAYCEQNVYMNGFTQCVTVDNNGNVYMRDSRDSTLKRFSEDLFLLDSRKFIPGIDWRMDPMYATDDGRLFVNGGNCTLWVFDTLLNLVDTIVFQENGYSRLQNVRNDEFIFTNTSGSGIYLVHSDDSDTGDFIVMNDLQQHYNSLFPEQAVLLESAGSPDMKVSEVFTAENVLAFNNGSIMFSTRYRSVFVVNPEKCLVGRICNEGLNSYCYITQSCGTDRLLTYNIKINAVQIYAINWSRWKCEDEE